MRQSVRTTNLPVVRALAKISTTVQNTIISCDSFTFYYLPSPKSPLKDY